MPKSRPFQPARVNLVGLLLIFLLPFAVVVYQLIAEIGLRIEFAQAELNGDRYLRPLVQLLEDVPESQIRLHRFFYGNASPAPVLAQQSQIDADLQQLAAVDRQLGKALSTTRSLEMLRQTWQQLKIQTLDRMAKQTLGERIQPNDAIRFQRLYTQLIADIRGLISQVGDTSNLILDPDLDSYYLMDAVLLKLPEGQTLLAQLRLIGQNVALPTGLPIGERGELIALMGVVQANLEATRKGLDVAFRHNQSQTLRPVLQPPLYVTTQAIEAVLQQFEQWVLAPDNHQTNWDAYDQAAVTALDASFDLWRQTVQRLDGLLHNRITKLQQKTYFVEAFALLVLGVTLYIFALFRSHLLKRQQSERRQLAQYEATRVFADATSLQDATSKILQSVCESLGWDLGEFWQVDEASGVLKLIDIWHQSHIQLGDWMEQSRSLTFVPGVGLPGRVWELGESLWIADLTEDHKFVRRTIVPQELRSVCGFPVIKGEKVLGTLVFFSCTVQQLDTDLVALVGAIGSQMGQFIKRQQTEAALRQSEALQRMALSAAHMGVWDWNILTGMEQWSDENKLIWGFSPDTPPLTHEDLLHRIYRTDRPIVLEALSNTLHEGAEYHPEFRIVRPDGSTRWLTSRGNLLRDEAGNPIRLTGVAIDITERKQAEAALREREERFRSLLSNITGVVYRCANDREWTMEFVSDAIFDLTGYPSDDFIAKRSLNFNSVILPDDRAGVYQEVSRGLAEQRPYMMEYRIRHADGSIRWVYEKGQGIRNEAGEVQCLDGVIFDITDRKHTEAKMRLLESVVVNTSDAVMITDASDRAFSNLKIIYVNQAFTDNTGYSPEAVIGQTPALLYGEQTDSDELGRIETAIAKGEAVRAELLHYRQDQSEFWMEVELVPIANAQGEIVHWVSVQRDTSTRRQAEDALRRSKEAAEEASRAKSQFLANMSHELRTPLNAIIGYSEMLQEDAEDFGYGDIVPDLEKIGGAGKHLLGLINDILDISKIEAGKMELYPETFELEDLLFEVESTIQPLVERNHSRLQIAINTPYTTLNTDLTKLRQVLLNLLSNAAKFTENGTIGLTVQAEPDAGSIEPAFISFQVSDTGIGMSPEQLNKVFYAFTQADASTTRKYGGTGLGLAISQHFCQMMGGEICVSSQLGVGSTFTIRLPIGVATDTIGTASPDCSEAPIPAELPSSGFSDSRSVASATTASSYIGTVLVIDDDPTVHALVAHYLEKEGFCVKTAASGDEGLALAKALQPNIITLDVLLPQMNGWEVLSKLKADPDLADIPVIVMSIVDDKSQGFTLGASDYLSKPVDYKRLTRLLHRYHPTAEKGHHLPGQVLVAEDDATTREMFRRMLEKEGWQVREAANGKAALAACAESCPDLVLLDLMMPEVDGFQFLTTLRQHPEWRSLPVVVVTALDLTLSDRQRLNGSVEQVLQKGAHSRDDLLHEVRDLVLNRVQEKLIKP